MHPFLNTIFPTVRKVSHMMLGAFRDVKTLKVGEKGLYNYVTEIDRKSEQFITEAIRTAYPQHGILGEEFGHVEGDDYLWIIDPLDGTKNFIHGFPHFCISIAIKHKGRLEHALIYDPIRDELFTATRGQGAFLNDRRIRVSELPSLSGALLSSALPTVDKSYFHQYMHTFPALYAQSAGLRHCGSAALALAYVAAGRVDGHWEMGLAEWDIAAGVLLVQEAGGLVSDLHGGNTFLQTGEILAAPPKIFKVMLKFLHSSHEVHHD